MPSASSGSGETAAVNEKEKEKEKVAGKDKEKEEATEKDKAKGKDKDKDKETDKDKEKEKGGRKGGKNGSGEPSASDGSKPAGKPKKESALARLASGEFVTDSKVPQQAINEVRGKYVTCVGQAGTLQALLKTEPYSWLSVTKWPDEFNARVGELQSLIQGNSFLTTVVQSKGQAVAMLKKSKWSDKQISEAITKECPAFVAAIDKVNLSANHIFDLQGRTQQKTAAESAS